MHRLSWLRSVPAWAWLIAASVWAATILMATFVEFSTPERFVAGGLAIGVAIIFQSGRSRASDRGDGS